MLNIRSLIFALFTLCLVVKTTAGIPVVERVQADSMRTQQVVYEGRVCPLNTPALAFTKALTGQRTFQGLSAEQVMLSWALYPEEWKDVRMVQVKDSKVRRLLGIEGDYVGIGHIALGYAAKPLPEPKPRKENYIYWAK